MTTTVLPIPQQRLQRSGPAVDVRRMVATALILVIVVLSAVAAHAVSGSETSRPSQLAPASQPVGGPPTSAQVLAAQG